MRSQRPKPLMKLCGMSMLAHVLASVTSLDSLDRVVVVVGHEAEAVEREIAKFSDAGIDLVTARQLNQRGTGDAVGVGLSRLPDLLPGVSASESELLVVPADTPLISSKTLDALARAHEESRNAATILTMEVDDPQGYGRIRRDRHGRVMKIVEDRELDSADDGGNEVNTGIYMFDLSVLPTALRRIAPSNSLGEYYLTDAIELLVQAGYTIGTLGLEDPMEASGVNDRVQLVAVEEEMRRRIAADHLAKGVMMVRPETITIDRQVVIEPDATIWPGALLIGDTVVGSRAEVGPHCRLVDTKVGAGAHLVQVDATGADIGEGAAVGPYVVLERGAKVLAGERVEPFSVVK